jgi:dimethylglycine dehydrogenase
VRVSFAGELGWEIHAATETIGAIYAALIAAGVAPYGMYALNALRLEKGYRTWKGDLSTDYTLLEGGVDRFIKWGKPAFVGKAALEAQKQAGVKKRFVTLILDDCDCDAPYMSTIWHNGEVVGEVTSCAYGYRVAALIALGMVRIDLAAAGTVLDVEIFGKRVKAVVQQDQPLWDPQNERLRA